MVCGEYVSQTASLYWTLGNLTCSSVCHFTLAAPSANQRGTVFPVVKLASVGLDAVFGLVFVFGKFFEQLLNWLHWELESSWVRQPVVKQLRLLAPLRSPSPKQIGSDIHFCSMS